MRKHWFVSLFGVLAMLMLPAVVFASGFAVNEHGAKAAGMGGAFVAQADDPSAAYFNPAGVIQLEGMQVSLGVTPITPDATFESNGTSGISGTRAGQTTSLEDDTVWVPNAHLTYKYNDRLAFSVSQFSNFGLRTDWPDNWEGRYIVGGTLADLKTVSINPSVAFKPTERISLAFGAVGQYLDVELKNKTWVYVPDIGLNDDVSTKFDATNLAWGYNLGLLVWLPYDFKFGASYRSQIQQSIKGHLDFARQYFLPLAPGVNWPLLQSTDFTLSLTTPDIAYIGMSWDWGPLTLEFDGQWTNWSKYNELKADFFDAFGDPTNPTTGLEIPKDWDDAWAYRIGAQYKVTDWLDLRAGFIRDDSPIPSDTLDPLIPSGDRLLYSAGFGVHYDQLTFDFAYIYLDDENRKYNNESGDRIGSGVLNGGTRVTGKFKDVDAHLLNFNITYRF
jgi:long-chain fatty acid transport protein